MLETALAKLLSLKVAAATVATVAATGGVAVAAATGAVPNPLSSGGATATPHPTGKPSEHAGKSSAGEKGSGSPSPSLDGLCHAFKAGAGDNPGKALENPAFTALITAAGDEEKVAAYCDALLTKRSDKAVPSTRPTDARPSRPAGKPDSPATSAPETRPTGRPASQPTAPPAK
ncbi:hypothetical protein [Micromonospora sp. NPDC049497]|uniref:hypothetical protein n=1 Tax=Micromonospora sp. NPDC049497 TaxID=3364273 RepID=UPI0037A3CF08